MDAPNGAPPKNPEAVQTQRLLKANTQIEERSYSYHSQHSQSASRSGSPHQPVEATTHATSWMPPSISPWLWEICAAIFSLACLGAMLVLIAVMHRKPLAIWRLPISPSALLAVFSTLAKSSALLVLAECMGQLKWIYFQEKARLIKDFARFEEASRGPLGAFELLYRIRGGAGAASLGCVLIIATLAIEPFTQQVLSFPVHLVPKNSTSAGFQVTQMYHSPLLGEDTMSALWASFFPLTRGYTCNSDNCTWTDFTTLEVCNRCVDVSKNLHIDCVHFSHYKRCGYRFPDSLVELHGTKNFKFLDVFGTTFNTTARRKSSRRGTPASIASIYMLDTSNHDLLIPEALECTLRWCARSYGRLGILNGTIKEERVTTQDLLYNRQVYTSFYDELGPLYPMTIGSIYQDNVFPSKVVNEINHTLFNMPRNPEVFFVDESTLDKMHSDFLNIFPRSGTSLTKGAESVGAPVKEQLAFQLFIAEGGNHSKMMDNFATALTAQIKIPKGQSLEGQIQKAEPFVEVSWPWILLPALVVMWSATFLVATILVSAGASRVVWKTSALSALFHGLDGWQMSVLGSSRTYDEMDELSKKMWAQLQFDERGNLLLKTNDIQSKGT